MSQKIERKKLLVSRRVQGQVLLRVLFLWAVYHVVLWHTMLFFQFIQYCAAQLAGARLQPFSELFAEFVAQHYSMPICAVLVLPFLIWDVLKTTHRFVGPLVQFQRCLARLTRGEHVAEVKIRKGDLLGELQDSFNEFLQSPFSPRPAEEAAAETVDPVAVSASGDPAEAIKLEVDDLQASIAGQAAATAPVLTKA